MIDWNVTTILCIIITLISIVGFSKPDIIANFSHYPYKEKRANQFYRMLSSGFLHANWIHLLINIYVLWSFGNMVESLFVQILGEMKGSVMFLLLFIGGMIFADLPTYAKHKDNPSYSSIGASGAVSSIVFALILFSPLSMFGIYGVIPVPAILFGVIYLVYSSWASKNQEDHVDHDAHFYGALFGILFTALFIPQILKNFVDQLLAIF
ncbi:MAG: rhomboid family intramembrane serine protease [Saprospiraceae bacterium]